MDGFTFYKNAKLGRLKHYPALVRRDLIAGYVPDGGCQSRGCEQDVEFVRAWLCPDQPGRLTVANLNGVRYCTAHAEEVTDATGMPLLARDADLTAYHDRILDIEHAVATGQTSERLLHASIVVVAKLGTLHRRRDGTYHVTLNDGSAVEPCCRHVGFRLIGFDVAKALPPHSTQCAMALDATGTR